MSRIFLTKQFEEGPTKYFAIDESKIETLNLSDTYDQFGQEISHTDAGDYSIENGYSNAKSDCEKAIEEKFGVKSVFVDGFNNRVESVDDQEVDYGYDTDDDFNQLVIEINNFIDEWRKENETFTEVKGFTYWNGHNWKTITVSMEHDEPTHEIVEDENLIAELNKAIEEKEYEGEGFGCTIYRGNGFVVVDSNWAGTWAEYEIVSEEGQPAMKFNNNKKLITMKAKSPMFHVKCKIDTNGKQTDWTEVVDQKSMDYLREQEKPGGNICNLRVIKEIAEGEEIPKIQQSPFHN